MEPNNSADTTVDEVLGDQAPAEQPQQPTETATPANTNEVDEYRSRAESLEKELSRIRAAQSAADKRAEEATRRARELEEAQKRTQYGDNETEYYKSLAVENARKAAELELKVQVSDLLTEHQNLPEVVKEAIRRNPTGFIGDATDVPTAVYKISSYLNELEAKNAVAPTTTQVQQEPAPKEFPVPGSTPRSVPSTSKPKDLNGAVAKLIESGLFS